MSSNRDAQYAAFVARLVEAHGKCEVPCELRSGSESFLRSLLATLFPHFSPPGLGRQHDPGRKLAVLSLRLADLVDMTCPESTCGREVAQRFMGALPDVHEQLWRDARAIDELDPASESLDEVVLAYPGFFAIAVYRIAHVLDSLGVRLIPRVLTEFAHRETGIDIHPGATIGCPFKIDHGTGIVIGQTSQIGNNVVLYQGVTIGALAVSKRLTDKKRHPTIEDDVVIYAGATILGGNTTVGKGSIVGGNVWLTESVPPGSVVTHRHEVKVRVAGSDLEGI